MPEGTSALTRRGDSPRAGLQGDCGAAELLSRHGGGGPGQGGELVVDEAGE